MRRILIMVVLVSGCAVLPEEPVGDPQAAQTPPLIGDVQRPQARPDVLRVPDTTDTADTAAPDVSVGTLGRTVASLGNPGEPGLWLKTPLVRATRPARLSNPATGQSVNVTLIPIEGPPTAGSRASLAAMQALGASPADLVELDVFGA